MYLISTLGDYLEVLTGGKFIVAISACFASPMLNLVLGIGFSCAYFSYGTSYIPLEVGASVMIASFGLLIVLILCIISVCALKFQVGRIFGMVLLCVFFLLTTTSLIVQNYSGW
jgi:sodium/potassium/calcium exchanger 6